METLSCKASLVKHYHGSYDVNIWDSLQVLKRGVFGQPWECIIGCICIMRLVKFHNLMIFIQNCEPVGLLVQPVVNQIEFLNLDKPSSGFWVVIKI